MMMMNNMAAKIDGYKYVEKYVYLYYYNINIHTSAIKTLNVELWSDKLSWLLPEDMLISHSTLFEEFHFPVSLIPLYSKLNIPISKLLRNPALSNEMGPVRPFIST